MILNDQKIFIKWGSQHKKYYELRGYKYTKIGDEFEVRIEDLTNGNNVKIKIQCDYCNEESGFHGDKICRVKHILTQIIAEIVPEKNSGIIISPP